MRTTRRYVRTGAASRGPISPRGFEHQREGLALGALRAFDGKVKGVDDGREPAVDRKVWRVRERIQRRGLRPWRGLGRRGCRARGQRCRGCRRRRDNGDARRGGRRAIRGKERRTRALRLPDKLFVASEKREAVDGRSKQRAARRVVEIVGAVPICVVLEQTVSLLSACKRMRRDVLVCR